MKESIKKEHNKNKELYNIKKMQLQEQHVKEEEIKKLEEEYKAKILKERQEIIKIKSDKFREDKKIKAQQERLDQERDALKKKQQQEDSVRQRMPVVRRRQVQAKDQFVELYKQKEILKAEKVRNETRLNEIAEKLKVRPQVEVDAERVKKITESLKTRFEMKRDDGDKVILFKNPGFTVDRLMSDLRFKISTALGEAGLLNSGYSNQLLNQLSQNVQQR